MKTHPKKIKGDKNISRGPGSDCECPVCVFSKSQAPGDPYDLKDCPKCRPMKKRDFDKEAVMWDTPPRVKLAQDIAGAILKKVTLTREMDVLDFGCGTGLLSLEFAPFVRSVTGVDSSKGMLEVLHEKVRKGGVVNVRTRALDLTEGESVIGQYDLIVSSMTLHHIQDIPHMFRKFYQLLRPGGTLAIADLDQEDGSFHAHNDGVFHFGFDRAQVQVVFEHAGFGAVSVSSAAEMLKSVEGKGERTFGIFLMTGQRIN